jgi:hypothetical protein
MYNARFHTHHPKCVELHQVQAENAQTAAEEQVAQGCCHAVSLCLF